MSVDRKEQVKVNVQGDEVVSRQEVVRDVGYERKALVYRVVQVIWIGVIALEVLLGTRVLLKLLAANPAVPFADFIYRTSAVFLVPFIGLTIVPSAEGVVLEIPTIIAMMVYLAVGILIVRLLWVVFKPIKARTVRTYQETGQ
jgi:hypothetical protein